MNWWQTLLALGALIGLKDLIFDQYKRWFPSKLDRLKRTNDFIGTTETAIEIHQQLDRKLTDMVDERTKDLEKVLIRRELEVATQVMGFSKTIYESNEKIKTQQSEIIKLANDALSLQNENIRLQNENLTYQKKILQLTQELEKEKSARSNVENDLKNAKEHIEKLEKRVQELESKLK